MQQREAFEPSAGVRSERPPNHLVRAIILFLLVVPIALILAASKVVDTWSILAAPSFRSEIPRGWVALMEILRGLVAVMAVFTPIAALVKSLQVNRRFEAGDFSGAERASKSSAYYSKQSIIFLILIILIIATDLLRFLAL